ncbi:hypothetical protein BH11PLA1_BH11PLA1_15360 [soil metagenome]
MSAFPGRAAAAAHSRIAARLTLPEKIAIAILLLVMLAFGAMVVLRSAYQQQRKTDFDVFARAAWAVRADEDIYQTFSERGWNYIYPSLFAITLTPLADPPTPRTFINIADARAGAATDIAVRAGHYPDPADLTLDRARAMAEAQRLFGAGKLGTGSAPPSGYLPFGVSCAIWYLISLASALLSAHLIARAIELSDPILSTRPRPALHERAWWMLRLLPLLICAPAVFNGMSRGQTDALVLLCISAFILLWIRRRSARAGTLLSLAAAIKVIPAFLLLAPLWRRDLRTLIGFALGSALFIIIIPTLVFGPVRMWEYNLHFLASTAGPGLGLPAADTSRKFELYGLAGTDSQSLLAVLHNTLNLTTPRGVRPDDAHPIVRIATLTLSAILVILTLWAARWKACRFQSLQSLFSALQSLLSSLRSPQSKIQNPKSRIDPTLLPLSALLLIVMLAVSPVTHTHYFAFALPLVAWLIALRIRTRPAQTLTGAEWLIAGAYLLAHALPRIGAFTILQDAGLMLWSTLALWALGVILLRRETAAPPLLHEQPSLSTSAT